MRGSRGQSRLWQVKHLILLDFFNNFHDFRNGLSQPTYPNPFYFNFLDKTFSLLIFSCGWMTKCKIIEYFFRIYQSQ